GRRAEQDDPRRLNSLHNLPDEVVEQPRVGRSAGFSAVGVADHKPLGYVGGKGFASDRGAALRAAPADVAGQHVAAGCACAGRKARAMPPGDGCKKAKRGDRDPERNMPARADETWIGQSWPLAPYLERVAPGNPDSLIGDVRIIKPRRCVGPA